MLFGLISFLIDQCFSEKSTESYKKSEETTAMIPDSQTYFSEKRSVFLQDSQDINFEKSIFIKPSEV